MTVMSTTKLSSTIAYSTPTNPNAHTIDVQPSLPFTFRKSKDNQTPKQVRSNWRSGKATYFEVVIRQASHMVLIQLSRRNPNS